MESVSSLWFNAYLKHHENLMMAKNSGKPTEGYSRAAMIAYMEYVCATAIEMTEAKKP